eukprot:200332_1
MALSASILSHLRRHTCCEQFLRRAKRGMSERLLPTAVIPVTASTNNRGGRGGDRGNRRWNRRWGPTPISVAGGRENYGVGRWRPRENPDDGVTGAAVGAVCITSPRRPH